VLVTRPAAQARAWINGLAGHGVAAASLPMIGIESPADPRAVHEAWGAIASLDAVVFVSPSAVERFFALRPDAAALPPRLILATPGPGSARALAGAGVDLQRIVQPAVEAEQFDSQSLWERMRVLRDWRGARVLIVRGGDAAATPADEAQRVRGSGREWLSNVLREAGAQVDTVAAYLRAMPALDAPQRDLLRDALEHPLRHVWLFSSSQAVENLRELAGNGPLPRNASAVCTHARIAAAARAAGFDHVVEAAPTLESVLAAVRVCEPFVTTPSIQSRAP